MADFDPDKRPRVEGESSSSGDAPLFTPHHVAVATFFGTPLAGFIVLGINDRRIGRPDRQTNMIAMGVVAGVIVSAIALALPENVPATPLAVAYVLGMQALAKQWQGNEVDARLSNGTPKASGWTAFGIGLLCLLPFLLVGFAIGWFFPEWLE